MEFSADGRHLITSDGAGLLQVWNAEFTGRLHRREVLQQEIDTGYRSVFALTPGRAAIVYSGVSDNEPAIFRSTLAENSQVGSAPNTIVASLPSQPQQLSVSRDGSRLVATFPGGLVKAWSLETNELIAEHQFPHDEANAIAFVPNERGLVLTSCVDKRHSHSSTSIWIWNLADQQAERITIARGRCSTMTFAADGRLAMGTSEGLIRVYDVGTKGSSTSAAPILNLIHSFRPHANEVACVRFSPNGRHLYSASDDSSVRRLDTEKLHGAMRLQGHEGGTLDFRLLPDGKSMISGGADGSIREWDIGTGKLVQQFETPVEQVLCVDVCPSDSNLIAYSGGHWAAQSSTSAVGVWNRKTGAYQQLFAGKGRVWMCRFSPDGSSLAAGTEGGVRIWSVPRFAESAVFESLFEINVSCLAWHPEQRMLAVGGNNAAVKIIDPLTGERTATVFALPSTEGDVQNDFGVPNSLEFSGDGKRLVSGHMRGRLWISEATDGDWQNPKSIRFVGHMGILQSVQLSEDGSRLMSCASDGSAFLWNTATGRQLLTWQGAQAFACARFSDDLFAFSGWGDDHQIRILPVLGID